MRCEQGQDKRCYECPNADDCKRWLDEPVNDGSES